MNLAWDKNDPIDEWECERARRIEHQSCLSHVRMRGNYGKSTRQSRSFGGKNGGKNG